ncbi:MAG: DNA mismatch repair endonuclease MutL, partial [Clostridium sp.]
MKRINVLDESTSNKIAAGEVVERPSSVVKELVENSIDAGAKNITVEIEDGGETLIRIIDDGHGIHPDDIKKAFMPHATSKIKSVDDIYNISTLGFRGEALPSIASVSKVTVKSKIKDEPFGREITIDGGEITQFKECGCNDGTTIEVKDIFFNVPARKKFLKSSQREGSIIGDILNRIALSHDEICFKFFNGGKKSLATFGTGNTKDVIRTIYGKTISDATIYFENSNDMLSIFGYIGKEEIARGSRNNQSIFVNGRYIKNKTLVAAVENAFKSFSTVNKFPFFTLFVEIYPEFVDVNIHPTKAEIKFKDDRMIFKKIFDTVHTALKNDVINDFSYIEVDTNSDTVENTVEELTFKLPEEKHSVTFPIDFNTAIKEEQSENISLKERFEKINANGALSCDRSPTVIDTTCITKVETVLNEKEEIKTSKFPPLRIIGQFNKTYILGEFENVLYLID